METLNKRDIILGFESFGNLEHSKILVHSSLSSFGYVDGGAIAVIEALLEIVGKNGTVLVPTFTGNESLSKNNPPVFNPAESKCWTGTIPETFRKRQGAIRSIHPTHSVCAIGSQAQELTKDHFNSITPCDEMSPYGKLASMSDSFVLLIGVDHQVSTMFHHVEEIAGVDYHIQENFVRAKIVFGSKEVYKHYLLHKYGPDRCFNIMEDIFFENNIQKDTIIGNATVKLVNVKQMVGVTLRSIRANKTILCKI